MISWFSLVQNLWSLCACRLTAFVLSVPIGIGDMGLTLRWKEGRVPSIFEECFD